jgi:hypothetical protein
LEDPLQVGAAGDFLDEEGGEAFRTELFVDAEEVDFGRTLGAVGRGKSGCGRREWCMLVEEEKAKKDGVKGEEGKGEKKGRKGMITHAFRIRKSIGMPAMKPTSLPFCVCSPEPEVEATRIPTCQSGTYEGGLRALRARKSLALARGQGRGAEKWKQEGQTHHSMNSGE